MLDLLMSKIFPIINNEDIRDISKNMMAWKTGD